MIIYDDDGIGHDVIPRQAVENAIAEIEKIMEIEPIDKSLNARIQYIALSKAVDIIRKHIKDGE